MSRVSGSGRHLRVRREIGGICRVLTFSLFRILQQNLFFELFESFESVVAKFLERCCWRHGKDVKHGLANKKYQLIYIKD